MSSQSQCKRQTSQSASTTVCIDTPVSERWLPVLNWLCISVWVSGFLASSLPPLLHADAKQLPDATKQSLVYSHVYRHTRFRALVLSSQLIVHYALSLLFVPSLTRRCKTTDRDLHTKFLRPSTVKVIDLFASSGTIDTQSFEREKMNVRHVKVG